MLIFVVVENGQDPACASVSSGSWQPASLQGGTGTLQREWKSQGALPGHHHHLRFLRQCVIHSHKNTSNACFQQLFIQT